MGDGSTVRAALVGYGLAGQAFHAPCIEATDGIELVAVVTADPERRRRASVAHPHAVLVETPAALFADAGRLDLDLVVVAAPNRVHVALGLAALEAGLAVVVDKPLAATAGDGRRLVAEAERRGLLLSVFHNRRWDGDFLTVRRLLREGALGEVWRFESRFERWRPERTPGAWRELGDPAEAGGLLADLGSHLVDQALVLFGPPRSVYAELARRRPGAEVDDDAFVALEHPGGTRSHLWASAIASRPGPRFRVLGSRAGYVAWGSDPQEAALRAGERPVGPDWGRTPADRWGSLGAGDDAHPVASEAGAYPRFYAGMVAALRDGAPPPVDPRDGVAVLEVLDAARASAATGSVVRLP